MYLDSRAHRSQAQRPMAQHPDFDGVYSPPQIPGKVLREGKLDGDDAHAPGSMAWMAVKMEQIFDAIREVRADGQAEYAHDKSNAFANFERAAADLGIPREHVLWIFAMKHRDGIVAHLQGHQSQREDVRGRIKDLMMYLILLWGMIDQNEDRAAADYRPPFKPTQI